MNTQRIEAARHELAQCFADYATLAEAYRQRDELRALLAAIVAETKPDDGARMVAIGGGWRRLPDHMTALINTAAEMLSDR